MKCKTKAGVQRTRAAAEAGWQGVRPYARGLIDPGFWGCFSSKVARGAALCRGLTDPNFWGCFSSGVARGAAPCRGSGGVPQLLFSPSACFACGETGTGSRIESICSKKPAPKKEAAPSDTECNPAAPHHKPQSKHTYLFAFCRYVSSLASIISL